MDLSQNLGVVTSKVISRAPLTLDALEKAMADTISTAQDKAYAMTPNGGSVSAVLTEWFNKK
jgi:hypothetical protein